MTRQITVILTTVLMLFTLGVNAQDEVFKEKVYKPETANFKQFVKDTYGQRADELVFDRWTRRLILKDYFTNRMTIVERYKEIPIPDWFQELSSIGTLGYTTTPNYSKSNFDPKAFNPFYYKIDYLNTKKIQHIHISGTNFYIKLLPFDVDVINKQHKND